MPLPTHDAVMEALDRVIDPELRRPVTDETIERGANA